MSADEAQQALEESSIAAQAESLLAGDVELGTNFTIGDPLEGAAQQLRGFIESQLPCAQVERDGATLSITYGARPGDCVFHGHTFAGEHTISIMRNAQNEVAVHHEWSEFNDGRISLSGSADVIWSRTTRSRHVLQELTWTVLSGRHAGRTGTGNGDRTQTQLDSGDGVRVDGVREWDGDSGHYQLDIDSVEMRWMDPVPQAGAYALTTPSGKSLTLAFERRSADTIEVTATTDRRSFAFSVHADGQVER